jgi:hypothetical protein
MIERNQVEAIRSQSSNLFLKKDLTRQTSSGSGRDRPERHRRDERLAGGWCGGFLIAARADRWSSETA